MVLASAEVNHPAQLRADFQQFYGLNIDGMGSEYTYDHAAALAANLPRSSRLAAISAQTSSAHRAIASASFPLQATSE